MYFSPHKKKVENEVPHESQNDTRGVGGVNYREAVDFDLFYLIFPGATIAGCAP